MSTPGIRFAESSIEFRHTQTRLRYIVPPAADGKKEIDIWSAFDGHPTVRVTALEVGSGGGKSTFANALAQYLRAHADGAGLQFSFINPRIDSNNRRVALIPQKPTLVSHWQERLASTEFGTVRAVLRWLCYRDFPSSLKPKWRAADPSLYLQRY